MAQPQAYNRETDFTERDGDDTNHAGINTELDAAALSINEIRDNLALIQRDDGALKNGIVTAESLSDSAFNAVLGEVATATAAASASADRSTLFATQAEADRIAAQAAASAAQSSQTAAATSATAAASSQSAAANSASSAATSASTATTKAGEASTSATNAATSATAAAGSATTASTQATNAANSATASATSATNSANSATTAATQAGIATTQASNAATSATAAAASLDDFDDRYLGPKSAAPTLDNDGNALLTGAMYFDTSISEMRVYTGTVWKAVGSAINGTTNRATYTATAGQTTFDIVYDVGFVDVYLNGLKLQAVAEFTATNGTSIVLATGATLGDIVDIVAYGVFSVADIDAQDVNFTQAGTGAVQRTVTAKLRDGEVSVKDFGAVGNGVADDILAIEKAIAASNNVYFPPGSYGISRPIVIQKEKMVLRGAGGTGPYGAGTAIGGSGLSSISVLAGFTGTTVGGSSGSAAIWYQAPGNWTEDNWIEGGRFENLTINCNNRGVEGIRFNRITLGQVFRNLRIVQPTIGILGTKWGWLTQFDNVYVNEPSIVGIRLTNGYNGCTFTNCSLYGGNITCQVLLDMAYDCYGNSWTGGFIEGGQVAVRLTNAQIAFHGTDFEVISEKFFEIRGLYTGPSLDVANPPVTITGCTFVGVPSVAGIEVTGGVAEVHGNFFINNGSAPGAGIYCLKGIAGGDQTVSGFEQPCISESDNVLRGWNGQLATGIVFSRIKRVATEGVTFPTTPVASANPNTLDDYKEGAFTPPMAGTGWGAGMSASGTYTKIGNRIDFVVVLSGATNSSVRTSSFLTGFPGAIASPSVASIIDTYNTDHGCTAVVSGFGNIVVYMPAISSTAATIVVSGSYFTS